MYPGLSSLVSQHYVSNLCNRQLSIDCSCTFSHTLMQWTKNVVKWYQYQELQAVLQLQLQLLSWRLYSSVLYTTNHVMSFILNIVVSYAIPRVFNNPRFQRLKSWHFDAESSARTYRQKHDFYATCSFQGFTKFRVVNCQFCGFLRLYGSEWFFTFQLFSFTSLLKDYGYSSDFVLNHTRGLHRKQFFYQVFGLRNLQNVIWRYS